MNIVIADERADPPSTGASDEGGLLTLAAMVLDGESFPSSTEVTVTMVDPHRIAELNRDHLGKTGPTDVLSFPIEDLTPGTAPALSPGDPPLLIGDVVICPAVVAERASDHGVGFEDEMALMVVHGLLHLLGYDHQVAEEAEHMESVERRYLAAAGRARR